MRDKREKILSIDVSWPLSNDIWINPFHKVDMLHQKYASLAGTSMCENDIIVNLSKLMKPLFLGLHNFNIINTGTSQGFLFIYTCMYVLIFSFWL